MNTGTVVLSVVILLLAICTLLNYSQSVRHLKMIGDPNKSPLSVRLEDIQKQLLIIAANLGTLEKNVHEPTQANQCDTDVKRLIDIAEDIQMKLKYQIPTICEKQDDLQRSLDRLRDRRIPRL